MARLAVVEAKDRIEIDIDARGLDGAGDLGEQAAIVAMIVRGVVDLGENCFRRAQGACDVAEGADLTINGVERVRRRGWCNGGRRYVLEIVDRASKRRLARRFWRRSLDRRCSPDERRRGRRVELIGETLDQRLHDRDVLRPRVVETTRLVGGILHRRSASKCGSWRDRVMAAARGTMAVGVGLAARAMG